MCPPLHPCCWEGGPCELDREGKLGGQCHCGVQERGKPSSLLALLEFSLSAHQLGQPGSAEDKCIATHRLPFQFVLSHWPLEQFQRVLSGLLT